MKIEKIHEDQRGAIYRILFSGKEFLLVSTNKGYSRGGDFHESMQHDVVLSGKVNYIVRQEGRDNVMTLKSGHIIHIEAGSPHMWTALEDSLIVEWLAGEFEKKYFDMYRKIVEEKLNV